jgi:hypothetical protein
MSDEINESPFSIGVDGGEPESTEMEFVSGDGSAIDAASGGFPDANYTTPDGRRIHVDASGRETPTAWHRVPGEMGGPPSIGPDTHTEAEHEAGRRMHEEQEERLEWLGHGHDPHPEGEPRPFSNENPNPHGIPEEPPLID